MDALDRLRELAERLPRGLRSDWQGSNHFELATDDPAHSFWWLSVGDGLPAPDPANTTEGKRFGLLMDVAEEVARLRDIGVLTAPEVKRCKCGD